MTTDVTSGQTGAVTVDEQVMLQVLLDAGSEYVFFKDRSLRFIRTSQAYAKEILALDTPQEALGKRDADFFSPAEAQQYATEERQILETGEAVMGREVLLVTKQGIEKQLLAYKYPLRNEEGAVVALVALFKDLSICRVANLNLFSETLELDSRRLVDQIRRAKDIEQVLQKTAIGLAEMLELTQVSIELNVDRLEQSEE